MERSETNPIARHRAGVPRRRGVLSADAPEGLRAGAADQQVRVQLPRQRVVVLDADRRAFGVPVDDGPVAEAFLVVPFADDPVVARAALRPIVAAVGDVVIGVRLGENEFRGRRRRGRPGLETRPRRLDYGRRSVARGRSSGRPGRPARPGRCVLRPFGVGEGRGSTGWGTCRPAHALAKRIDRRSKRGGPHAGCAPSASASGSASGSVIGSGRAGSGRPAAASSSSEKPGRRQKIARCSSIAPSRM